MQMDQGSLCVFYPETNGQTDGCNQEMETGLRCITSQNPSSWSRYLLQIEYGDNSLPIVSTGVSHFQRV